MIEKFDFLFCDKTFDPPVTSVQTNDDNTEQISNEENSNGHPDTDEDFFPDDDEESVTMLREALDHLQSLCGNKNCM